MAWGHTSSDSDWQQAADAATGQQFLLKLQLVRGHALDLKRTRVSGGEGHG